MTINRLIKELEKLRAKHGKRVTVAVDSEAMQSHCNEVFSITDIGTVTPKIVNIVDGDGFTESLKDGTEKQRLTVVLGA